MIELASRTKRLPAPPRIVWESLVEPHGPGPRPWLELRSDEVEPQVLAASTPHSVVWSSLWPSRPTDQIHFELRGTSGETTLSFVLLTPAEPPDQETRRLLGRRLSKLLFADLRYSYGQ